MPFVAATRALGAAGLFSLSVFRASTPTRLSATQARSSSERPGAAFSHACRYSGSNCCGSTRSRHNLACMNQTPKPGRAIAQRTSFRAGSHARTTSESVSAERASVASECET